MAKPDAARVRVRAARAQDAPAISALIAGFACEFTERPNGAGAEAFMSTIAPEALAECIDSTEYIYLVAEADGDLAGAAALRRPSHLYHLFVAGEFQGRGVARLLWDTLRSAAEALGNDGEFTVNSSPGALAVYERFGFVRTGPEARTHGIEYVPMALHRG